MEKYPDPKDVAVLIEVYRQQSLSKAAEVLGLPNSHVSRRLRSLEAAVGVLLVSRSTRRLNFTDVGEAYATKCIEAFEKLAEANDYLETLKGEPQGLLRVILPFELGLYLSERFLAEFTQQYPQLRLEVSFKNIASREDYASVDLVVEIGRVLAPETFIKRRFASVARHLYATPRFLKSHRVQRLEDVKGLIIDKLNDRAVESVANDVFVHARSGERRTISADCKIKITSLSAMKRLALSDVGICYVAPFMVREELKSGSLKRILPQWQSPPVEMFVTIDPMKRSSPKVVAFIEALQTLSY